MGLFGDVLTGGAWGRERSRAFDNERAQAIVRIIVVSCGVTYMAINIYGSDLPDSRKFVFTTFFTLILLTSAAIVICTLRSPGVNHPRRMIAMAHDYAAITFALIVGGEILLPIYATLLWATIGNGLRYGPRYLVAATVLALSVLGLTSYFSAYWREQPYVAATLIVTTILVPTYAYMLLTRVHRAHAAALEANLAKSRFLAQASHDLRQPIHAISLFTACLRDAGLGAEERQMIDNIDKSLQGVSRLFRSLLDVSTLDSGKVTPRPEKVSLNEILDDVVRQNSEAARWAGVTLKYVPTTSCARVDPSLIATMVQNIVSNALKYAPGRPVLIGCRRRKSAISIEVYDRGPGIPAHEIPRLFEEFYQVRERGDKDTEGVGLGLSIVRRLATLMDLTVSIRSETGRGTLIAIDGLPIAPAGAPTVAFARSRPASLLSGLRVLLVEDDADVLLATATLLEKWGCAVQPETALPEANVFCDLVITDFDLGAKTTGAACIARVRRLNGREIPAIVMTGHDENRVREELGDPAIPILAKPVRPSELRSAVMAQKLKADRLAQGGKSSSAPAEVVAS